MTLNEIKGNMKHVFQNTSDRDSAASPQAQLSSGQHKQGQPLSKRQGDIPCAVAAAAGVPECSSSEWCFGRWQEVFGEGGGGFWLHTSLVFVLLEGRLVLQPWVSVHVVRRANRGC